MNKCWSKPIGCGQPAIYFRDSHSQLRFKETGFCQICQDKIDADQPDVAIDEDGNVIREFERDEFDNERPSSNNGTEKRL